MPNMRPILNADSSSEILAKIVIAPIGSAITSSVRKYPVVSLGGSGHRASFLDVIGAIINRFPSADCAVRYNSAIFASGVFR